MIFPQPAFLWPDAGAVGAAGSSIGERQQAAVPQGGRGGFFVSGGNGDG
jgi:hypothetical protein